ncbi:acyl-CoA dehydrogenase [Nocardia sp. 852002-20019_SCH5090214]|jgi:alkylation response protein AidB-like acyl-CoA dehydrogenase|uniref:Acyl-CoA dehydrogenase n=1 Tax=Nocardia nova TaxID=37330 RepID=A0A2S5ZVH6_9NOCA|nr:MULTISPECIES: acyl-CoA dehydrogenase family protein [Nocardia]MBF6145467.1 acyl-CoA/acyl-ACP dehydrogenase [Nocardia nova]MBV7707898.1 acyl-CoA/acyl-ACP dehydrogenase [Nocardia nova]OBA53433.1 acyl-CoA dehydrogenase [Nocardia sp. 852002-20019_SCH5090214]PPI97751.1 acyl-CoA dehydrogenase [Nocardia nova]PPJ01134.1 acyl-CoA dehydrogenase [Nocardia nova]
MYKWSDEDLMLRDAVRGFIKKEIEPHVDRLESGALPPFDIIRKLYATFGLDEMAREGLAKSLAREEAGTPGKSGGFSGSGSMGVILNSELAGVSLGLVASMGVSLGLAVGTIRSRGTLAQKKRWLPELVTFEKVGAWAITEPDSGSDAFGGMKSYVRRDGEDYILNGRKTFITNGPYADVTVVYAKLDEEDGTDRRDRKVLTFVLDKGMPGFVQSAPFKKMGMNSSPTGELVFDNVRLTPDRLLGETENPAKGDGKDSAKESFAAERIGIASLALGIINECHRLCVDYAKSRTLWGKEIGHFQLIQLKLAEMEVARINVQNMVFNAIERTAAGESVSLAEASAMKLYSSRAATEVAMEAVQLFGGNGYMSEYKVEQLARDAKSLMIYAGSNEIQVTHIAKGLLNA